VIIPAVFDDTICAPSTPPLNSSIAVIRMTGPGSLRALADVFSRPGRLEPRRAVFGSIVSDGAVVDDVVAVYYRAPHSFTGEDMAEISCHGNPIIVKKILDLFIARGTRLAGPGEFSRRAFLNGKIDLTGAEAINHIVRARGEWEIRAALDQMHGSLRDRIGAIREKLIVIKADIECGIDFSEEDIEFISRPEAAKRLDEIEDDLRDIHRRCMVGERISHGIDMPIIGRPNVGKSSILNLVLNAERAIVSDIPGTTRDLIRETVQFGGIHVNLFDTAGIAEPGGAIEAMGMDLSRKKIVEASMILVVLDAEAGIRDGDAAILEKVKGKPCFYLANKIDLVPADGRGARLEEISSVTGCPVIPFSAKTGEGMERLEKEVAERLRSEFVEYRNFYIADMRITGLLDSSFDAITKLRELLAAGEPPEITAFEFQGLIDTITGITGEISPDDVLNSIFSRFCIGK
jgi:tRNA modification GTPase